MRTIKKTINLSDYKSFIESIVPAVKDGIVIDPHDKRYQKRYNIRTNYKMCPFGCEVTIKIQRDGDNIVKFWSWNTLHDLYKYVISVDETRCFETQEPEIPYYDWLGLTWEEFIDNFTKIKKCITDWVLRTDWVIDEQNKANNNLFITFRIVDNITPYGGCGIPPNYNCDEESEYVKSRSDKEHVDAIQCYSNLSIPINLTNTIDNLGQVENLIPEWEEKTDYGKDTVVAYDKKDWILKNTQYSNNNLPSKNITVENGYTWDNIFKESIFGNLYFDITANTYANLSEDENLLPWKRNIENDMSSNVDYAYFLGEDRLTSSDDIKYAYKDYKFIANPTNKDMATKHELITVDSDFIFYEGEIYEIKEHEFIVNFNCDKGSVIDFATGDGLYEIYTECGYYYIIYKGERIYGFEEIETGEIKSYIKFEYNGAIWKSEVKKGFFYRGVFYTVDDSNCKKWLEDDETYAKYDADIEFEYPEFLLANTKTVMEIIPSKSRYCRINNNIYVVVNDDSVDKLYTYELYGIYFYEKDTSIEGEDNKIPVIIEDVDFERGYRLTLVESGTLSELELNSDENTLTGLGFDDDYLYECAPYTVQRLNYIEGTVESKLSMFKMTSNVRDEIGNRIKGVLLPSKQLKDAIESKNGDKKFSIKGGVIRPLPDKTLSMPVMVGSVRFLKHIKENYYFGNIISSIEFGVTKDNDVNSIIWLTDLESSSFENLGIISYTEEYHKKFGNNLEDFEKAWSKLTTSDFKARGKDVWDDYPTGEKIDILYENYSLGVYGEEDGRKTPTLLKKGNDNFNGDPDLDSAMYDLNYQLKCRILYNLGAILEYDDEAEPPRYRLAKEDRHKGVVYEEWYTIERTTQMYYRSINDCYQIYIPEMHADLTNEDQAKGTGGKVINLAKVKMEIPLYELKSVDGKVGSYLSDKSNHFGNDETQLDKYKGFITVPTVRKEYYLGTASQEKVEAENIYIERGISSAFERHLRLQEIKTLTDLENYSNGGFFTISTNE